jgi:RNA polymerase sigma-70 factor (ECF subfamily)
MEMPSALESGVAMGRGSPNKDADAVDAPKRPANEVPRDTAAGIGWAGITRDIQQGDSDSFDRFYEHFFDMVYRQVRQITGRDEATCLDIVQEAMLKMIRSMRSIDSLPQLTGWVRVVTRTTTYDWLRRENRRTRRQQPLADSMDRQARAESLLIEDKARICWLEEQLQQLPVATRRIIALRYRVGWTLKQVAAVFGMKTGAVDGRIRRAVEKLRRQADEEFANHD